MLSIQKQEKAQTRRRMFFKTRTLPVEGHHPKLLELAERTIMGLLLSVIRFDEKATRTERRLEDKMVAFREIWEKFIGLCKPLYLVGSAVWIDEQLLHSEEDADSGNICRKKQASMESKFG